MDSVNLEERKLKNFRCKQNTPWPPSEISHGSQPFFKKKFIVFLSEIVNLIASLMRFLTGREMVSYAKILIAFIF